MSISPKFLITKDDNSNLAYGTKYVDSAYQYQAVLLANVETTMVIPENVDTAILSYSNPTVWTAIGSVAITVPVGDFANTPAVLNHAVKEVIPGETLRFISSIDTEVGVVFFNRNL